MQNKTACLQKNGREQIPSVFSYKAIRFKTFRHVNRASE